MGKDYEVQECDVLVVGGGISGLIAAIRAKDFADRVFLVEKAKVTRSGGSIHAHAYGSPAPEGQFERRLTEMVQRSSYLGDQAWFEILLREIGDRLNDLEKWGAIFLRDEHGQKKSDAIRGQSKGFVYLARGKQVMEAVADAALKKGIKFFNRIAITDLLTSDGNYPTGGHVTGAVGLNTRTGEFTAFNSKAVIIASGAIGAKLHGFATDNLTGDGYAMAFRAGAEITGLEFTPQPFGLWNRKFGTSGPGQFQHGGTKLINRLGEEFLYKYEGASREFVGFEGHFDQSAICRAVAIENIEGRGPCYFDCRAWGEEKLNNMRKVLPMTMKAFDEPGVGVDLSKEPVETNPMVGIYGISCQSGIRINTIGETKIAGLYAAGVAAYYGPGPGPQSLCIVGGYRAGEAAAKWAKEADQPKNNLDQIRKLKETVFPALERKKGVSPEEIYYSVNKLVTPWGASLFKHEKRIKNVLYKIREIAKNDLPKIKANDIHGLVKAHEAKNFVLLMELYNMAALERKESRMAHFREDYPYIDDRDWRKWIFLQTDGKGGIKVNIEPVSLGCSAIMPASLTRKPAPVAYKLGD